jgi:hypothetical protein
MIKRSVAAKITASNIALGLIVVTILINSRGSATKTIKTNSRPTEIASLITIRSLFPIVKECYANLTILLPLSLVRDA